MSTNNFNMVVFKNIICNIWYVQMKTAWKRPRESVPHRNFLRILSEHAIPQRRYPPGIEISEGFFGYDIITIYFHYQYEPIPSMRSINAVIQSANVLKSPSSIECGAYTKKVNFNIFENYFFFVSNFWLIFEFQF